MIAALFVEADGIYRDLGADVWSLDRDARNYAGPYPVVAHPPCQLWGNLAAINFKRWGGEHNRPGNDDGCFSSALASVRRFGGVLEHPAHSRAFSAHDLPRPASFGWTRIEDREWVCEVWQSAYGHLAQKRTWLFYCGNRAPFEMDWTHEPGTHQCGHDGRCRTHKPILRGKLASATPVLFARALLALAWTSAQ